MLFEIVLYAVLGVVMKELNRIFTITFLNGMPLNEVERDQVEK